MQVWETMKSWMGRARAGAGDLAQSASLRLDVRGLEGRRNHLLRAIGDRALKMHQEGRGIPDFDGTCREIEQVDREIAAKRAEMERGKEATASPAGA